MEEMRGCRFALQRGYLLVVTHNRITGKTWQRDQHKRNDKRHAA